MCDVKYSWVGGIKRVERADTGERLLITLAGCQDDQVAEDTGKNGAMTACLLHVLKKRPALSQDVFELVEQVASRLKTKGFRQTVKLCSSYDLNEAPALFPPGIFQRAALANSKT
jgi:hypothetical protein